ncbi:MAG: HEPN domain-containing protein [Armatimonadetes bacterium]|nr:HEPN domain-containing protein [Armatimonadota bacterium]
MSDRDEAVELLQIAERELRALKGMLDAEVFSDEVFGFLAQQAAEKALKSWLCILGQTYLFTHDLVDLLSRVEDGGADVADFWSLADLNPFAVELRYSALTFGDSPLDRADIIGRVEELIRRVAETIRAA